MRAVLTGDLNGAAVVTAPELEARIEAMTDVPEIALPQKLDATLRPYQERGYAWLMKNLRLGLGALIADDMGLGKTLQVIAAMTALKEDGEFKTQKALVVVPTTLLANWARELAKFSPGLTVGTYHGTKRKLPAPEKTPDVTLTSYGTLRRDAKTFASRKWRLLVLDEAQVIKNRSTAQSIAVKSVKAPQVLAMSGTPVENRLMEYWSILSTVQPKLLGSEADFRRTFADPIEREHDERAIAAFRRLTAPFMLRRLKSDPKIISDLPEKNVLDHFTSLTPAQTALYKKTLDEMLEAMKEAEKTEREAAASGGDAEAARMKRKGLVLRLITALKQICNSPSQYQKTEAPTSDSGKGDALLAILGQCRDAERKVLIFTQFREMGEKLQDWIEAAGFGRPAFLHGGVPVKARMAMVDKFQTDRTERVMIISLKAGGTGLNLTSASAVVHYDLWWNPAVEELLGLADLILLDVKQADPERHLALTGHDNARTLRTAAWLEEHGKPFWLRYVLVPGYSDAEADIRTLGGRLGGYRQIERVELLPYHTLGVHKYEAMGKEYKLSDVRENTPEQLDRTAALLREYFANVVVN